MRAVVVAVLLLAACKDKGPSRGTLKLDSGVEPEDARKVEVDAAIAVEAKPTATKVVVGDHVSCAIMSDATLRCWGKNSDGQLGNGTTVDSPTPVKPNLRGVVDVVLGDAHACALLDDHSVTCWGRINYGHKDNLLLPAAVPGVSKVERIFAMGAASCGTRTGDASPVCWGDIEVSGHPRVPSASPERRVPTPVDGLTKVTQLTANGALHEDGTVTFWAPDGAKKKTALVGVKEIAASGDDVCGLREDGSVACAGPTAICAAAAPKAPPAPVKKAPPKKATKGKGRGKGKGKGKAEPPPPPPAPEVMPVEVLRLPAAKHLAFDVGRCVIAKSGTLSCLDAQDGCKQGKPPIISAVAPVKGARGVAVSSSHACALLTDHEIVCWGSNQFGALGRGEIDDDLHREARPVAF